MLAFDIETTGLCASTNTITAACVYDPVKGIKKTFLFALGSDPYEFIQELDNADQLCAFNGARFDIPFIQKAWHVSPDKVKQWRLKLFDLYEMCVLIFKRGFSLNQLLQMNKIPVKTGTGKEAIVLAQDKQWAELGEYCMQDTIKTWEVSNLSKIRLPLHCCAEICLVKETNQKVYFEIQ